MSALDRQSPAARSDQITKVIDGSTGASIATDRHEPDRRTVIVRTHHPTPGGHNRGSVTGVELPCDNASACRTFDALVVALP
jgi:hypothetical protein